jgi:hypothetical protein
MKGVELREQRRQHGIRKRLRRGHAHHAGKLLVAAGDLAIQRQEFGLHPFGGAGGQLAGRGELITALRAVEEPYLEM